MTTGQALLGALASRRHDHQDAPDAGVLRHLIRAGHLTESGLSRRARPRPCPHCCAWTIAGLDADVCALETHVDPSPLTPLGEMLALLDHRPTFELVRAEGRFQLERRHAWRITFAPAGSTPRADVLALHRCDATPISGPALAPTAFAEANAATYPPGTPAPF